MPAAIKARLHQESTQPSQGTLLEHLAQVIKETVPLSPTEHLLYKTTLPGLRDVADLLNT